MSKISLYKGSNKLTQFSMPKKNFVKRVKQVIAVFHVKDYFVQRVKQVNTVFHVEINFVKRVKQVIIVFHVKNLFCNERFKPSITILNVKNKFVTLQGQPDPMIWIQIQSDPDSFGFIWYKMKGKAKFNQHFFFAGSYIFQA